MISNRLNQIVNLITQDQNTADIGSDHGYVLIELRKRGFSSKLLGVENKKAPFLHLITNVALYPNINIDAILSDGIDDLPSDFKTVIIAGMGYQNIVDIVTRDLKKLDCIDTFVIDSHTDKKLVRPLFAKLGYEVGDEIIVFEDGIFYDLVRFEKAKNKIEYSDAELEFGPFHIKNKDSEFINMIDAEIAYNNSIIERIKNTKAINKINSLKERNNYLEAIKNEN